MSSLTSLCPDHSLTFTPRNLHPAPNKNEEPKIIGGYSCAFATLNMVPGTQDIVFVFGEVIVDSSREDQEKIRIKNVIYLKR